MLYELWIHSILLARISQTDYTVYELFAAALLHQGIRALTVADELTEFLSPDEIVQLIELQKLFTDEPNLLP